MFLSIRVVTMSILKSFTVTSLSKEYSLNLKEKHNVGIDCHKDTIACYLNGNFKEFKTDFKGFNVIFLKFNKYHPFECRFYSTFFKHYFLF